MCGIAGAPSGVTTTEARRAREIVSTMTEAERHRGPDGSGIVVSEGRGVRCALGHRRLAIIDVSLRAAQPMKSASAPIWITFNGEIYNFGDVRRDLEAMGRRFVSQSDTEVVLQGYEVWGEAVLDRLRGMFAFAIYDGTARPAAPRAGPSRRQALYVLPSLDPACCSSPPKSVRCSPAGFVRRRLGPHRPRSLPGLSDRPDAAHARRGRATAGARAPADDRRHRTAGGTPLLGLLRQFSSRPRRLDAADEAARRQGPHAAPSRRSRGTSSATCPSGSFSQAGSTRRRWSRSCARAVSSLERSLSSCQARRRMRHPTAGRSRIVSSASTRRSS